MSGKSVHSGINSRKKLAKMVEETKIHDVRTTFLRTMVEEFWEEKYNNSIIRFSLKSHSQAHLDCVPVAIQRYISTYVRVRPGLHLVILVIKLVSSFNRFVRQYDPVGTALDSPFLRFSRALLSIYRASVPPTTLWLDLGGTVYKRYFCNLYFIRFFTSFCYWYGCCCIFSFYRLEESEVDCTFLAIIPSIFYIFSFFHIASSFPFYFSRF